MDTVGTYMMAIERNKCWDTYISVFAVEVSRKECRKREVRESNRKILQTWVSLDYFRT